MNAAWPAQKDINLREELAPEIQVMKVDGILGFAIEGLAVITNFHHGIGVKIYTIFFRVEIGKFLIGFPLFVEIFMTTD